jgi:hypothetical protein
MRRQLLIFSVLFFLVISCRQNPKEPEKIYVHKIEYNGEKLDILNYSLSRYDSASCNVFHYTDSSSSDDNTPLYRDLMIDTTNVNYVIFCSDTFIFKGSKIFEVNQKKVLVNKYWGGYRGLDTGLILYLNNNSGLIILQSFGWGTKFAFISDFTSEGLINLLLSDTSGFVLSKKYEEKFLKKQD